MQLFNIGPSGWIDVIRDDIKIEFDLERTPLQIKTNQGGDVVNVWFYDESGERAGRIYLRGLTSPSSSTYEIYECMTRNFPDEFVLPIDNENVWTITKLPGPRIIVQCNEVTVVDVTMSGQVCKHWPRNLRKDVSKIKFSSSKDTASKYYRPKPLGNKGLTNSFWFNKKRITKEHVLGRLGN